MTGWSRRAALCVTLAAFLLAGCAHSNDAGVVLAVASAVNANVTLAADGNVVAAAWSASGSDGTNIYAARSDDGGQTFARPVRVNDIAGDASVNGEAPPRIVLAGRSVEVVWVSKRHGVAGIRAAASSDGGATFGPARTVTAEGVTGARGWQTAALAADGTVHVAWLDGRNAAPAAAPASAAGAHDHHQASGDMRQDIYYATWRGGNAPAETRVASNVCFCCKTAIASRGDTIYVAWRHLFPGGVRDIAIARSSDGGRTFSDPVRVSADNWHIDACPDDGPALAVDAGGTVHVTWPTLVQQSGAARLGVFASSSSDGGVTFSPRDRVDGGEGSAAHPKLALDAGGRPVVVWDEAVAGARRVRMRVGGESPLTLSGGRIASYPSVALTGSGLVAAWTDQSDKESVIRVMRIDPTQQ